MMNIDKLSKRLAAVEKYIPTGSRLADIGSDHAYLPCHAVKEGIVPFAIAGEVAEGPFQSAKKTVESEHLTDSIHVRKGDGLEVVRAGEVDCITIAGMGGSLIASILENGKEKLSGVKRLILQPNNHAHFIRSWLVQNNWELIGEEVLEEDGKIYEILVAEKGDGQKPYQGKDVDASILLGPFLLEVKNEAFQKKWGLELKNLRKIYKQLSSASQTEENISKKNEILKKIQLLEEILNEKSEWP